MLTIDANSFALFLKALDPSGDDYLSNWGEVDYEGYDVVLNRAVEMEISGSDNDVDLISGVIQAQGRNAEFVNKILKQVLGYDGIIINNPIWGEGQTIYSF